MKLFFPTPAPGIVIPAQAGIQCAPPSSLDSRLRGNDGSGAAVAPRLHATRLAHDAMDN
ncbi:MAG: hypothetical protein JSR53_08380 [Proteobacteria bacterium]|nr:hypothetical protein [Pseudomonadota bacterium]